MAGESYDLHLTTLSPIHIGSGKSYSCCEFVPAKAKSKGQIVKIIKRVNLTNYYSSLSDDRKDTFLASLTNSNFELKQFDKKIKKDFVRYQCIDNSRVDFINEVQEHIKTSDKLYIPGSSIKGAIRTAIFYNLLTEEDMDKIGKDISSNRRINSLSDGLLKKYFTSGFGNNDAQYNIFRFMQVADTTTTNLPRIEQVLAVMATDDRRKNQFYSRHGKVVKSYLETIGANKNLQKQINILFKSFFINFEFYDGKYQETLFGEIPIEWNIILFKDILNERNEKSTNQDIPMYSVTLDGIQPRADIYKKKITAKTTKFKIIHKYDLIFGMPNSGYQYGIMYDEIGGVSSAYPVFEINGIQPRYVDLFIKNISNYFNDIVKSGSRMGQGIDKKVLLSKEIYVPPNEHLDKYYSIESKLLDLINHNLTEINNLTKLRDTLLPKLMSGEIDVSKINCDLELKYNYMKYLFNQIHTPMSKSVV